MIEKIEYSRWGLANRIGNIIVLNEGLRKYPSLHDTLLAHEEGHNEQIIHNLKHDYLDVIDSSLKLWFLKIKFMFLHPRSWIQVLPFLIYKGRIYFDLSITFLYILTLTFIIVWWLI